MDGHCRDVEEIIGANFPVFALSTLAVSLKDGNIIHLNDYCIGSVTICSGDL